MNRIFCSTGALIGRPNGRNLALLAECINRLECDGFEFMMYESWYDQVEEVIGTLKSLPTEFPVVHSDKLLGDLLSRNAGDDVERAFARFEINCALAEELGADRIVLHLWGGLDSDRDIGHNYNCYRELRKMAGRHGLTLCVENIVCAHADPMTHLKEMIAHYPDVVFTFDTKMAEFHRQMEDIRREENRDVLGHIGHMHINDYRGGIKDWANLRTLQIGEGQIDFAPFFQTVKAAGYRGDFTVESTAFDASGVIRFDALNRGFQSIRDWMA